MISYNGWTPSYKHCEVCGMGYFMVNYLCLKCKSEQALKQYQQEQQRREDEAVADEYRDFEYTRRINDPRGG